jgi:PAS domain S-box-containing protein
MVSKNNSLKKKDDTELYSNREIIDLGEISDAQLLLDACPYAMILASVDGYKTIGINEEAANIFQKTKKELIGSTVIPLLDLNAVERRRQVIHRLLEEKKPYLLEDYERGMWWRTFFQPIKNKDGIVTKIAVTIQNISQEKSKEQNKLEKNEEFWTRLIEYSNNAFFIVDDKGIIRYVSTSVKNILGKIPEDMVGKKIIDFVYLLDKKRVMSVFSDVLSKKGTFSLAHRIRDVNGEVKFVETTANNLLNNPIVRGVIVTTRDVTKRHKAQIETQETKKYLENIIDSASEFIFSIDQNKKITLWNERARLISGYSSSSIIGKNIFSLSLIQDIDSFEEMLSICRKHESKPFDLRIQTKHGENRLIRIHGSPIKTNDGSVKGIVFTGRDITSDAQIHGNLVTGYSYLILEEKSSKAVDLMNGLLLDEYDGLIITRDTNHDLFENTSKTLPITKYYFTQSMLSSDESYSISDSKNLVNVVSNFCSDHEKSIVLLDRLDFFIALNGFESFMQTIYQITSIARRNNGIILIRLNPSVFNSTELAILHEELRKLPEQAIDQVSIDRKLFEILRFVDQQNRLKTIVSYKTISKQFSITKVTTAKRISALSDMELIAIKKRGRLKTIFITDKGKRLLQRRTVV